MSGGDEMSSYLESVLARISGEHSSVLLWFLEHEGEVGPRPWRRKGISVVPGVGIPIVAERGIHKPSGWDDAVSITVTSSSAYRDGEPEDLGDGTWALPYFAHRGVEGRALDSHWNRALAGNYAKRIPVGVFVHRSRSNYLNMGLAFVEGWDTETGVFHLRGPVRWSQGAETWGLDASNTRDDALEAKEDTARELVLMRRRRGQTQFRDGLLRAYKSVCAVTGYDAVPSLEAAHILGYSGVRSQAIQNGILLRADLHLLFDKYLMSVDPKEKRIRLASALLSTKYSDLDGVELQLPAQSCDRPDERRLAVHWGVFCETGLDDRA
jgi:putative restriction endonuclease